MKIVSGMQGTRNREISSENKDKRKKNYQKRRHIHEKKTRIGEENKGKETRGRESFVTPVKHPGKWFLR